MLVILRQNGNLGASCTSPRRPPLRLSVLFPHDLLGYHLHSPLSCSRGQALTCPCHGVCSSWTCLSCPGPTPILLSLYTSGIRPRLHPCLFPPRLLVSPSCPVPSPSSSGAPIMASPLPARAVPLSQPRPPSCALLHCKFSAPTRRGHGESVGTRDQPGL